ncbi:uncharacterized protein PV07_07712 [Cladophialophora immunda]|uniref:BZIP domain-containing protein n=1 Tax=Cladophialophora immunda TaxID=569365 RepID=A0A0D2ASE8_9EURO|nr:uncharacterized protein PV07_07712 [Cladophialophora immunda]KIW28022.1 hypothetical protein PV07_07712 [Cladophialophora immunda]
MTLNTEFTTSPALADDANAWQFALCPEILYDQGQTQESPIFSDSDLFFPAAGAPSAGLVPQRRAPPEFVQPRDLHPGDPSGSTSPASQTSQLGRTASIDSATSSPVSLSHHQQLLRRMSLASVELNDDAYRPRNTPARRKKSTTGRIAPRSEKHARELELNRRAATKCRNRQKVFIEHLQQRCRKEEEKLHVQTSLVSALHDEVVALRNEVLRQSFCDCRFLSSAGATVPLHS